MKLLKKNIIIDIEMPEIYVTMTDYEKEKYFRGDVEFAYVDKETKSIIGLSNENMDLDNDQVVNKIMDYQFMYSRLTPGFQMGEILHKIIDNRNVAILSFKSNAISRDLYNIVSITSFEGKEYIFNFSCNLKIAEEKINEFIKIIESISFSKED